jgi:hypothetical protein
MEKTDPLTKWAVNRDIPSGRHFMHGCEPLVIDFGKIEIEVWLHVRGEHVELAEKLYRHGGMDTGHAKIYGAMDRVERQGTSYVWDCNNLRLIAPSIIQQEFSGLLDKIEVALWLRHGKDRDYRDMELLVFGSGTLGTYDQAEKEIMAWLDSESGACGYTFDRGFEEGWYFTEDTFIHCMPCHYSSSPIVTAISRQRLRQAALGELARVRAELGYLLDLAGK